MKRNKNFWSYRLHKVGTPKVFRTDRQTDGRTDGQTDGRTDRRTDGRSGPITRPAFAKATQVRNRSALAVNCRIIIHCLEVSCKEDQIMSAQRE